MFDLTDLLCKAALNLPDEGGVTLDYFLKDFQTEAWYWLFRALFALGLVMSIFVYLYYRHRQKFNPENPAAEAEQSPKRPVSSTSAELVNVD